MKKQANLKTGKPNPDVAKGPKAPVKKLMKMREGSSTPMAWISKKKFGFC